MSDRRGDAVEPAPHPGPLPASANPAVDALAVFALALGLRVWHVLALRRSPFFDVLMGDSLGYDSWARRIAAGEWMGGDEVFYQAPLYPYFLAVLYSSVSDELLVVRLAQAVLGSLACLLLALASGRFLQSRAAGLAAGLMLAVYAPAIFHDGLIQKSTLDLLWLCGLLWLLSRLVDDPGTLLSWAAGAVLGVLTLTRENASILLLPIALWLWIHFRAAGPRRLLWLTALLVGLATVLLPVALRNHSIDGSFHLTTSQFGPNFYHGNNADSDGTYRSLRFARGDPRYESLDAESLAEKDLGRELVPAEISRYWTAKALDYIAAHPLEWLGLVGRKLLLLVNATEVIDTEDQYTYARWSPVLRLSGTWLHFGVLAPLALLGVFATWNQRRRLWLLYAMGATYAASVLLFYVVARYRLPLVPFLILGTAAALSRAGGLPARLANLSRSKLAAMAVATAALAVLANWPSFDRKGMAAANYYNLGIALHGRGDDAAALDQYRSALEIVPDYPEALWAAGISLAARGELAEAISSYRGALALRPDIASIHQSLAVALSISGDMKAAVQHYEKAVQLEPQVALTHFHLAIALAALDRAQQGRAHAEQAVALDPTLLKRMRGIAWRRATTPGVGTARSPEGRLALHLARWCADLTDPPTPHSLDVLAASHAAAGRYGAARRIGRTAAQLAEQRGNANLAAELYLRLERYTKNQPFIPAR